MLFGLTPLLLLVIIIALLAGGYMAWNIGANDVANSMSTAVGANAITLRQAVVIASVLNFVGAVFLGSHVTETVKSGIVETGQLGSAHSVMLGFLAAILAASFFVTVATWLELPVSTTHSIIGGITGFGFIAGGAELIVWEKLGEVAASWVLSPIAGAAIAFVVFRLIVRFVFAAGEPVEAAEKFGPVFVGLTFFIVSFSLFTKTDLGTILFRGIYEIVAASAVIFVVAALVGAVVIRRLTYGEGYNAVEFVFRRLQVITSCYVALSHGANDVANAIAPLYVVLEKVLARTGIHVNGLSYYLLALGGVGIAVGVMTWGYKVIRTLGSRITDLTNTRGFSVDFGTATTVLVASKLGLPISTSHTVVGAVIGVGLARGLEAVDLSVIKKIVYSWAVTLPATVAMSIVIYRALIFVW